MDHRLRKKKQFSFIYRKGKRISNKFLTLFVVPSKYDSYKIGYSVSKKIGKATVRNKVKRRLKEIVRNSDFPKDKFNYILMVREGIENLEFIELTKQVKDIFSKIWKRLFLQYFAGQFIYINFWFHHCFQMFVDFCQLVQHIFFKQ